MEMNEIVEGHGKQLTKHEREIVIIKKNVDELRKDFGEVVIRMDESNKYLREQNTQILSAVLSRNEKSEAREHDLIANSRAQKHELSMLNWSNLWKILAAAATAGGFFGWLVQAFLNK